MAAPDRRFYGRRVGRPLRQGRQALLETLLPRFAVTLPAAGQTLSLDTLFGGAVEDVWLEIGFGGGEHLLWQADANPGIGLIGCEPFLNGVASLLASVRDRGLETIRILPDDGRPLLWALPGGSLGRIFLLFPDPWHKARHHRRRFLQPDTLDRFAALLRPGGELRMATDDPGLLDWMLALARPHPAFAWRVSGPEDWRRRPADWPQTRYEAKRLKGPPHFLRFVRI